MSCAKNIMIMCKIKIKGLIFEQLIGECIQITPNIEFKLHLILKNDCKNRLWMVIIRTMLTCHTKLMEPFIHYKLSWLMWQLDGPVFFTFYDHVYCRSHQNKYTHVLCQWKLNSCAVSLLVLLFLISILWDI